MKNMLNIKEFQIKDKLYEFRLSYKAKVEIDKENRKSLQLLADENISKALPYINKLSDPNLDENERLEAMGIVAPLLEKEDLNHIGDIDPIELGYILLHNIKGNESITKEEYYDEIIPSIEETLGFEKMYEEFMDMHDKVFTQLEAMNKKSTPNPSHS